MRLVAIVVALVCVILSGPVASLAQPGRVPRVGYLLPASEPSRNEPFWEGLRKLGYVEGRNIVVERRYSEGRPERLGELAADLVRLKVDVIVADSAAATQAARRVTATIPIVMIAADPVALGLIASLPRPGANVTGLSTNSPTLMGKRLELLKAALPRLSRVAVLWNPGNPGGATFVAEAESAGRLLGLPVHRTGVRDAGEIEGAFAAVAGKRADALLVIEDPILITNHIHRIVELAVTRRLPTMAGNSLYARAGLLMSYGPHYSAMFRRTAFYVDKILKGAKPSEIPVEEPTTFELLINLKTARAMGLPIPPSVLARADQVIE